MKPAKYVASRLSLHRPPSLLSTACLRRRTVSVTNSPMGSCRRLRDTRSFLGKKKEIGENGSRVVLCRTPDGFTEEDLNQMSVLNLRKLMKKHGIKNRGAKLKKTFIKRILDHFQMGDKSASDSVPRTISTADTIAELKESLGRFTIAELKIELNKRKANLSGRKMELIDRLVSLMEEEQSLEPPTTVNAPFDINRELWKIDSTISLMDEMDCRLFLDERKGTVDYSAFVNVRQSVRCFLIGEEAWSQNVFVCDSDQLIKLIDDGIEFIDWNNSDVLSLRRYGTEVGMASPNLEKREDLVKKLNVKKAEMLEEMGVGSPSTMKSVKNRLILWFQQIQHQLSIPMVGATEAEIEYAEQKERARSFTIMVAEVLHKALLMSTVELSAALSLTHDHEQRLYKSRMWITIAWSEFLIVSRGAIAELYNEFVLGVSEAELEEAAAAKEKQEEKEKYKGVIVRSQPTLMIGVIFGSSRFQAAEVFSGVRCLIDHYQTASYPTQNEENGTSSGMHVSLYYVDVDGMHFYRLTTAEFLRLDVSAFERSLGGIWNVGESIGGFGEMLKELKSLSMVIPITSSLDAAALLDSNHASDLKQLDGVFLGSSTSSRQLLSSRYKTLTFLRSQGFNIPPLFQMKKQALEDVETWNEKFTNWRNFHGLEDNDQQFYIHLYASLDRLGRQEVKGLGEIVACVKQGVLQYGMEEATIQPLMDEKSYAEFSCVVLETRDGPVALTPTEFEQLPTEYVRSLSSPLRSHSPPRFEIEKVQAMRRTAVRVFRELHLSGYATIHGRILIDPEAVEKLRNEKLTYPRPLPLWAFPTDELELPPEFVEHMKYLQMERDGYYDDLVESYDQSTYTAETRRYFQLQDEADAERGITIDREKELDAYIEQLRHRNDRVRKIDRLEPLKRLMLDDLLDDYVAQQDDATAADVSTGPDYSIVVTGVDCTISFATNHLLFRQAALSGLSHGAVLFHLMNLKLPPTLQLPMEEITAPLKHPTTLDFSPLNEKVSPSRTKEVWILCGGESTGHQASLLTAVNAMIKFRKTGRYMPSIFIMDSGRRTRSSPEVLRNLIERRNSMLENGVPEEELLEECSQQYLNSPKTVSYELPWRPVWAVHDADCLTMSIDDALEGSDRLRRVNTMSELAYDTLTISFRKCLLTTQRDLDRAGIEGVASLWGGSIDKLPPSPRMIPMEAFALEAAAVGATVFLAVHGDIAADGSLQHFFSSLEIPFTGIRPIYDTLPVILSDIGCDATTSGLAVDKYESVKFAADVSDARLLNMERVSLSELVECGQDMQKAESSYSAVQKKLQTRKSLCIRPLSDCFSGGAARIASAADLHTYGKALNERWEMIEGEQLKSPHTIVPMPKPQSEDYILQHYQHPGIPFYNSLGRFALPARDRYVELSFGLVGSAGCMWVMNPSLIMSNLETEERPENHLFRGITPSLTPIPSSIVDPQIIKAAKSNVEKIADSIGLKGAARIDAFVDLRTGAMTVIEIDTTPFLGEHSLIFQQAVAETPPMYPEEVFEQMIQAIQNPNREGLDEEEYSMRSAENGSGAKEAADDLSPLLSEWDESIWEPDSTTLVKSRDTKKAMKNLWDNDDDAATEDSTRLQNTS